MSRPLGQTEAFKLVTPSGVSDFASLPWAPLIEIYIAGEERDVYDACIRRHAMGSDVVELVIAVEERSPGRDSRSRSQSDRDRKDINRTFYRLRMIVLIALTTGMRMAEIFGLIWNDLRYAEGLVVVRAKLKGGRIRHVPMTPLLAAELRKYPAVIGEELLFAPKTDTKGELQRVEHSFATLLKLANISNFRFHDLRHTFASWYMMNGGDLYELAKVLGHSNIRMTGALRQTGENPRRHGARNVETNGRGGGGTGSGRVDVPVLFPRLKSGFAGHK